MTKNKFDIQSYYDNVIKAVNKNETYYCYNEDREHNAAILSAMLHTSNTISMYCGSMSIFRCNFWEKVNTDTSIKATFQKNLKSFGEDDTHSLEIVVEKYPKDGFSDMIFKDELQDMLKKNILKIFKLTDHIEFKEEIPHFTFAAPCFVRVEQDKVLHSALCAINNTELMESSKNFYSKLKGFAEPIDL